MWGPDGTFIGDNNALALALIMVIPLMVFLRRTAGARWLRHGLAAAMLLTALAALGAYSRGALLAMAAMAAVLWLKSRSKTAMGALLLLAAPLMLAFMPPEWSKRMESISNYQADASAQGRINAWGMAWNLARDRFFGGGFAIYGAGRVRHLRARPDRRARGPQHLLPGAGRARLRRPRPVPDAVRVHLALRVLDHRAMRSRSTTCAGPPAWPR